MKLFKNSFDSSVETIEDIITARYEHVDDIDMLRELYSDAFADIEAYQLEMRNERDTLVSALSALELNASYIDVISESESITYTRVQ
jgi:hypothetical protein